MSSGTARAPRGLLDTCVVVDLANIPAQSLPVKPVVSTVTVAEIAAGVQTASDPVQRSLRVTQLLMVEANLNPLEFGNETARAYGMMVALVVAAGRSPRPRKFDLMIAATAVAHGLPLYTRNVDDFKGLESQLTVIPV
ncbi:MAG: type II toxin-antitoxin system VapC family toxin [Actinocrinis sp.]